MINLTKKREEKLDSFLKNNQPVAPKAPEGEYQQILSKVENAQSQPTHYVLSPFKWALPAMAAAALAVVLWVGRPGQVPSDAVIAEFLSENLGAVYEVNGEEFSVGDEWFQLVEAVSPNGD